MSYPKDLEEMSDKQLYEELNRRQLVRSRGLCSYCHKPLSTFDKPADNPCKIHETVRGYSGNFVVVQRQGDPE